MCHEAVPKRSYKRQLMTTAQVAKAEVMVHPISVRIENKW